MSSEKKTLILRAAVRVIAQDGVRGLRVEKLSAEAGVSTALIYYHFKDRAGILQAALAYVNERAEAYTTVSGTALEQLEQMLLRELQDSDEVRENSIAWGELRASAVFNTDLRAPLESTTRRWNLDVAALVREAWPRVDAELTAEHLTALVEGLSERWHSGSITLERARQVLLHALHRVG